MGTFWDFMFKYTLSSVFYMRIMVVFLIFCMLMSFFGGVSVIIWSDLMIMCSEPEIAEDGNIKPVAYLGAKKFGQFQIQITAIFAISAFLFYIFSDFFKPYDALYLEEEGFNV